MIKCKIEIQNSKFSSPPPSRPNPPPTTHDSPRTHHQPLTALIALIVTQCFLFTSLTPAFATSDSFRSHLRVEATRGVSDGAAHILRDLRELEGNALNAAVALRARVGGEGNQDRRIAQLIDVLREIKTLDAPPEDWLPILVYALAPGGEELSLSLAVEKSQDQFFQEQCQSCGISLLYEAPRRTPTPTRLTAVDLERGLFAALATAIDIASNGHTGRRGVIKTHPATDEVMHSAYAMALLVDGYVGRFSPRPRLSDLESLRELLKDEGFLMVQTKEIRPEGDHYMQVIAMDDRQVSVVDRGEEKTLTRRDFLQRWTGIVISPDRDKMVHLVPTILTDEEARNVYGCCGITAPSSEHMFTATDAKREVSVAYSFGSMLASIAKRVINILQSRGFDNYADARKYWFWITEEFSDVKPKVFRRILLNDSMVILDVKGNKRVDGSRSHKILQFMVSSRGVGSSVANSERIAHEIDGKVVDVAKMIFPNKTLFLATSVRTSDLFLYDLHELYQRGIIEHGRIPGQGFGEKAVTLDEAIEQAKGGLEHPVLFEAKSREEIEEKFIEIGSEHRNFAVLKSKNPGEWELYESDEWPLRRVYLEGVNKHTRYKTKGTDREENAHHWFYKGYTLGHNGDFESYLIFRAILERLFPKEEFEGETDSEVLLHLIGKLGEEKVGEETIYRPSEIAIRRAFRLIERVETLLSLGKILKDEDKKFDDEIKNFIRGELGSLELTPQKIQGLLEKSPNSTDEVEFNEAVEDLIESALKAPGSLDGTFVNYYLHFMAGKKTKGSFEYFSENFPNEGELKKQVKEQVEEAVDVLKRGVSNIAINMLSLHDTHQIVVAKMYKQNNNFFLLLNKEGDQIVMASEARGAAPEVAIPEGDARPATDTLAIARGKIRQIQSPPWSILTVDGLLIRYHDILTGEVEDGRDLLKKMDIKWNVILDEKKYASETDFERESKLQPTTLDWTFDAFVKRNGKQFQFREEVKEFKLTANDFKNAPLIVGVGSGSSLNALRQVQMEMGYFDIVESSNDIQYDFPKSIKPGSIFVMVSQSGETGAAREAAEMAIKKGAKVFVITNRRGSSLYGIGMESGGVMVTEGVDEQAVAATGSNSGQVQALRLFGLRRRELMGEAQKDETESRLRGIERVGRRVERVLQSFDGGGKNSEVIKQILTQMETRGVERSFVGNQFILTGMGDLKKAAGDEVGLKITEVSRHPVMSVDMDTLLAFVGVDPQRVTVELGDKIDGLVKENLYFYAVLGDSQTQKKGVTQFGTDQNFHLSRSDIEEASQIVLLQGGRYDPLVNYLYARYRGKAGVPVTLKKYSSEILGIRKGAVVIAIDPRGEEALQSLRNLEMKGAKILVVTTETGSEQLKPVMTQNVLLARGAVDGVLEQEVVYSIITELLMIHLLRIRKDRDTGEEDLDAKRVHERIQELSGLKISDVVRSFSSEGHSLHNKENMERLVQIAKNRDWRLNIWSTGKTQFFGAAVHLSLQVFSALKRLAGWGETSEFKHGPYSATSFGDVFITQYPGKGSREYRDVIKTALDEVIPRINYPYQFLSNQFESGTIVFIGAQDPNDGLLRYLDQKEYDELWELRKPQEKREKQKEQVKKGTRPDIVFLTPTGHFLERLVVNYLVTQSLADAKAEYLQNDERQNVVFVVEGDPHHPAYREISKRFQEKKEKLKMHLPPGAFFVSIAPKSNDMAKQTSDVTLETQTDDFTEVLVVAHRLAAQFVRHRFGKTVDYLHTLYGRVEGHDVYKDQQEKGFKTPGELLIGKKGMKGFATGGKEAAEILEKILEDGGIQELKEEIVRAFEYVNMDFFKAFNSARVKEELWHSLIDLIEKLAKVVTNRDGGNRRDDGDVLEERNAFAQGGSGLTWQTPSPVSETGLAPIAADDGEARMGVLDEEIVDLRNQIENAKHPVTGGLVGPEGFLEIMNRIDVDALPDLIPNPLQRLLVRELIRRWDREEGSSRMDASRDIYLSGFSDVDFSIPMVLSISRLLDSRIDQKTAQKTLVDILKRARGNLFFTLPNEVQDRDLYQRYGPIIGQLRDSNRLVSPWNISPLGGSRSAVFLLNEEDQRDWKITPEQLLSPTSLGGLKEVLVVPLNAEEDLVREATLAIRLASQPSLWEDLSKLDLVTQAILAEVVKMTKLDEAVQQDLERAKRELTQILVGL